MSNDVTMTVVGNVVDEPRLRRVGGTGTVVTSFRVGSTSRRFDRESGRYVDNSTLFVSVSAWRQLGENVAESLRKGQPVVVTGRYQQRSYEVDGQQRIAYELEATAVGHDLSRGTSDFAKTVRAPAGSVVVDSAGVPREESEFFRDYTDGADVPVRDDTADPLALEDYVPDPSARGLVAAT